MSEPLTIDEMIQLYLFIFFIFLDSSYKALSASICYEGRQATVTAKCSFLANIIKLTNLIVFNSLFM